MLRIGSGKRAFVIESSTIENPEAIESLILCEFAVKSENSAGREIPEAPCPLRTCFQRDRDRIIHSKAFRRLKHKTQVFMAPLGDHYRTRLTHTLEVSQVSRTIARALRLNEDLTEAIALGHDLGHPPFGHTGEEVLNKLCPDGFHHELQSIRIVKFLEPLNLTQEVLEGMAGQFGHVEPPFLEAAVVKTADRMTYLHHDVEDAIRAGLMRETDIPRDILQILGSDRGSRLNTLVLNLVRESRTTFQEGYTRLRMSSEIQDAMAALRQWMFDHIYLRPARQEEREKVRRLISALYEYYLNEAKLPLKQDFPDSSSGKERRIVDYIAGMTDQYAIHLYRELFLPVVESFPFQSAQSQPEDGIHHRGLS